VHDGSARVPGYGEGSAQRLPKYVRVYAVLARGAKSQRNADQRLLQSDCARRPAARRTVLSVSNGARAASQNPVWCRCATGWQVQTPQPHRLRLPLMQQATDFESHDQARRRRGQTRMKIIPSTIAAAVGEVALFLQGMSCLILDIYIYSYCLEL
jgi:hypothetical protein